MIIYRTNRFVFKKEQFVNEDQESEEFGKVLLKIHAYKVGQSNSVSGAVFWLDHDEELLRPLSVSTDKEFQRQGLASRIYWLAEKVSNYTLVPGEDQTPAACAFWQQKDRKFGA